jgi:tRNA(Ile)-lysidine synthetase-like protein
MKKSKVFSSHIPDVLSKALENRTRILIAVSGGIDSCVLLHAVMNLAQGHTVEVAHVDHKFRESSGADAKFVQALCASYSIPCHLKCLLPPPKDSNLEKWAREQRYAFFSEVLDSRGLEVVLTAHHANDVAETFLMRLLANKELYSILAFDPVRRLLRPLLQCSKSQLEAYGEMHDLAFVYDETNSDTTRYRNQVRQCILPYLESECGGAVTRIIAERAFAMHEDLMVLNGIVDARLASLASLEIGSKSWYRKLCQNLRESPDGMRWRLCERAVKPVVGFNLGRLHSDRLVEFFLEGRQGIELPNHWRLVRQAGGVKFEQYK